MKRFTPVSQLTKITALATVLSAGLLVACSEDSGPNSEADKPVAADAVGNAEVSAAAPVLPTAPVEAAAIEAATVDPLIAFTEVDELAATVANINHETREVTLLTDSGEVTFVVSDEVRNLDQVSAGDAVLAEYTDQLTLALVHAEQLEAEDAFMELAARAEEGSLPGLVAGSVEVRVFMIDAIDLDANTFKLRNAEGVVRQFNAQNPENLKLADVGDALVVTHSTSLAVGVVPAE